jgi:hypothetical protein
MRQYLYTLAIASLTFFAGNFVGQTLDRLIFRDDYNQSISYQISQDWQTILSDQAIINH